MTGPTRHDALVYRGDTWRRLFRLWQDLEGTDPVDLTGVTVEAAGTDGRVDPPFTVAVTLPNSVLVTIPAGVAADLVDGRWDLQLTWPDGVVLTVVAGLVRVTEDVTP